MADTSNDENVLTVTLVLDGRPRTLTPMPSSIPIRLPRRSATTASRCQSSNAPP